MSAPRRVKLPINGVLLLDKPYLLSSNTALQRARWLYSAAKGGHTGVLDPLATGLLPLCFGEATKFSSYLLDADKGYRATVKFGEVTTTGDIEGEVVLQRPVAFTLPQLQAAIAAHTGPISQVPPMYSALKHQGKALYEYAREGIEIKREARDVTIHRIDLISFDGTTAVIDVLCSKGTYIRTLVEDIGEQLYNIDRMMLQLKRAGKLKGLKALIVGGFSDSKDTERPFGKNAYQIIADFTAKFDYPKSFGFPVGHEKENVAVIVGGKYSLDIDLKGTVLSSI